MGIFDQEGNMALNREFALITMIGLIWITANPLAYARKEIHRQNTDGTVSVEVQLSEFEKKVQGFEYQAPSGAVGVFLNEAGQPITAEGYVNLNATRYGQMIQDNGRILREMELAGVKPGDPDYENIKRTNQMLSTRVDQIRNEVGQVAPFDSIKNTYIPISEYRQANTQPMNPVILNQKFDSNFLPGNVAYTNGEKLFRKNFATPGFTEIDSTTGQDKVPADQEQHSRPSRVLVS